ncbi:MAG: hypothetical protein N2595_02665 [bacterium]|nr:hypothetical protein [bacterium]
MRTWMSAVLSSVLLLRSGLGEAGMVRIVSQTDSNGFFRYTVMGGDEGFWWGGRLQTLAVWVPARSIVGIVETPGWVWSTNEPGTIFWQYLGSNTCVLNGGGTAFAYTSSWYVVTLYDDLSMTGEYPRALVMGEVYDTNGVLYRSASAETGSVASLNVCGYERVRIAGPMVPELGSWCMVLAWLATWAQRMRG